MPKTCTICCHERRDEIDRALMAGEPLRDITGRVQIAKSALHRHKQHLSATLVKARESQDVAHADQLLEQLRELTIEARRIKQKAEAKKDYRTALAAVRELSRIVEIVAKIRGEIDTRAEVNVMNLRLDAETAKRIGETFLARHQRLQVHP